MRLCERAAQGSARPRSFGFLTEACASTQGQGAALDGLAQGIVSKKAIRGRSFEAELYRIEGELLLMQGAANARRAERCFRAAIEVARRQQGKALKLSATASLARLLAT